MADLRVLKTLLAYVGVMVPPLLIWPVCMLPNWPVVIVAKLIALGLAISFMHQAGNSTATLFVRSPPAGLFLTRKVLVIFTGLMSLLFILDLMIIPSGATAPLGVSCSLVVFAKLQAAVKFWDTDERQNDQEKGRLPPSHNSTSTCDVTTKDRRILWILLAYFFVVIPPLIIWSHPYPPFWNWRLNTTVAILKLVSLAIACGSVHLAAKATTCLFVGPPPAGLSLVRGNLIVLIAVVGLAFVLDCVFFWTITAAHTVLVYSLVVCGALQSARVYRSTVQTQNEQEEDVTVSSFKKIPL